jgi:Uma2 family endonuclease
MAGEGLAIPGVFVSFSRLFLTCGTGLADLADSCLAHGIPTAYASPMVASVLTEDEDKAALEELLRPAPLADGTDPEQRVVYYGISWERYLAIDERLGEDRPGPRLYYLDGQLEIMGTSNEHERIKKWLGDLLADFFLEKGIEIMPRGQATMRLALKAAGAEPDESWCLHEEKQFPDLVLEIALTSGGINKLDVYRRFKVPEVWFWRRNKLEIFALGASGDYEPSPASQLLPGLDLALLEHCVGIRSWQQARRTFRAALSKGN